MRAQRVQVHRRFFGSCSQGRKRRRPTPPRRCVAEHHAYGLQHFATRTHATPCCSISLCIPLLLNALSICTSNAITDQGRKNGCALSAGLVCAEGRYNSRRTGRVGSIDTQSRGGIANRKNVSPMYRVAPRAPSLLSRPLRRARCSSQTKRVAFRYPSPPTSHIFPSLGPRFILFFGVSFFFMTTGVYRSCNAQPKNELGICHAVHLRHPVRLIHELWSNIVFIGTYGSTTLLSAHLFGSIAIVWSVCRAYPVHRVKNEVRDFAI